MLISTIPLAVHGKMWPSANSTPKSKPSSTYFISGKHGVKWEDAPVSGIQFLRSLPLPIVFKRGSNFLDCFNELEEMP
jgi:hypothetical protein